MASHREPFQPESYYHIYSHAVGSENLFREAENYRYFLRLYARHAQPIVDTFSYCLLPNHFHFFVQIHPGHRLASVLPPRTEADASIDWNRAIAQRLGNWLNAYSKAYNRRYQRRGRLFVESMKRKRVTNVRYLYKLVQYIHWNPVHHGFVSTPDQWPYSSYRTVLEAKPSILNTDRLLTWFGTRDNYLDVHRSASDLRLFKRLETL